MPDQNSKPVVVLIHGLSAHRLLLVPMAWFLRRQGFETKLFGYRSMLFSIQRHAKRLNQFLSELDADSDTSEIHIVAHSMGGIVTRQAILDSGPGQTSKISRILLLAPPNQGSPTARLLSKWIFPFCYTLGQVSDSEESYVRNLPEPEGVEIGIVAATYDRVIPTENSKLSCQSDHILIRSGHNGLLVRPTAFKRVLEFLQTGRFESAAENVGLQKDLNPNA